MIQKTIRDVLKGRTLYHIAPETTLLEAAKLMETRNVGALAVLDDGKLVGILSERDVVRRGVSHELPAEDTVASAIMTRDLTTVKVDDALSDALAAKIGETFRHLPVMEGDRVVGLLSYRDVPAEYKSMFERFEEMRTARPDEA